MEHTNKTVVLAYSGGLDTSIILKWLTLRGYDVIAFLADIGQKEDFAAAREKALSIGARKVHIIDLKETFVSDYIYPTFASGAMYEGRYLLGSSLARPLIAKAQMQVAAQEKAEYVSHGCTGKGNDQIRFELTYYAHNPSIKILSPWKMPEFLSEFTGRSDMLSFADQHNIPVSATRSKSYSEDENLLHISHESGILEDPSAMCAEEVYSRTTAPENAPDKPEYIEVTFKNGIPVKVVNNGDNTLHTAPMALFCYLNEIGARHGIGRLDMVENRYVGIKTRGIYETPGGTILYAAHTDLCSLTMDREVMRLYQQFGIKIADLIYNGFWFSPEMSVLMEAVKKTQDNVNGTVTLKLYKGLAYPVARTSPTSLYNADLSSMDVVGGFNQMDAAGFIKINAMRLTAWHNIQNIKGEAS